MEIKNSDIKGKLIYCRQTEENIGKVKEIIINHETGAVLGILTNQQKIVVSQMDILSWKEKIEVNDTSALVNSNEIIAVKFELDKIQGLIGKSVETEKGKKIGELKDFWIDINSLFLTKIYVKKIWLGLPISKRIISYKSIIKITPAAVVVKKDILAEKEPSTDFFKAKNPALKTESFYGKIEG